MDPEASGVFRERPSFEVGLGAAAAFLVAKATMKPTPVNPAIEAWGEIEVFVVRACWRRGRSVVQTVVCLCLLFCDKVHLYRFKQCL